MFLIPFQINPRQYSIFVCLQADNLERMRVYDPAEVVLKNLGPPWTMLRLKDVIIGIATEEDQQEAMRLIQGSDLRGALRHLSRGFAYRPDAGDHDAPYLGLKKQEGEGRA